MLFRLLFTLALLGALLLILGWQPHEPHKQVSGGGTPALVQPAH